MDTVRLRLRIFAVLLLVIMVIGVLGFMLVEGLSLSDAVYFSIVTIATVGYGDIHPATQTGKILAILLIITGVGTFLGVVANATEMMLNRREKQRRLQKLNMVIGVFFSQVGTRLLAVFAAYDPKIVELRALLLPDPSWSDLDFDTSRKRMSRYNFDIDVQKMDLEPIRNTLNEQTDGMLRLLENPSILEHESFTDLLQAAFHLREELASRGDLGPLPHSDREHLKGDVLRVYRLLVLEWISYIKYLKNNYPYLYSLAIRTNPFDPEASPVVT
jgi:voltage-gated potassium channel